jgi:hypothetical protein
MASTSSLRAVAAADAAAASSAASQTPKALLRDMSQSLALQDFLAVYKRLQPDDAALQRVNAVFPLVQQNVNGARVLAGALGADAEPASGLQENYAPQGLFFV